MGQGVLNHFMTTLKGTYENGIIKLNTTSHNLKEGQEVLIAVNSHDDRLEKMLSVIGSANTYASQNEIDEYLKDCRSE